MHYKNTSACSGPLFLTLLLPVSTAFHAQAPAAGTSVSVKMLDAVNSASDPPGKQYRATVVQTVGAGNGITIAQGAAAIVTLMSSGSGYTAQLSSVTINGQAVAVTSNSASVTSAAQSAAGSAAASAVNSVLGGFGHRVSAPASVVAAVTGQHVSVPTGTTLTFVLGAYPAAPAAPAAEPMAAFAAPAPAAPSTSAASSGAGTSGAVTALVVCYSTQSPYPSDPNNKTLYLSAAFETPANRYSDATLAFSNYLKATYNDALGVKCLPIFTTTDARNTQTQIAGFAAKLKAIDTGWGLGQPAVAQGQSGFDPLAQGAGGIDLSQHRQTTYFCSWTAAITSDPNYPNHTTYISQIFQADWDPAPVSMAYKAYIRDHYAHDLDPAANLSPACSAQSPAMQTMQHQSAMISNKRTGKSVAVDFTYTSGEAAEGNAAMTQVAARQAAAAQAASAGFFISCSTSGGAGIDTYFTGIMPIKTARTMPNGATVSPESQPILDHFYAYLTQRGYKFKPGSSSACDIARTAATAQAAQHKRAYEGGGCSTCGKVVETGWKDE